jgi:hypothetical protein
MDLVLTPGEVAERLELEPDLVVSLFEQGYLSGFRHGDSWRITLPALTADLERLRRQLEPEPKAQLAPKADSAFRVPPALFPKIPRLPEKSVYPERFEIAITVENESDYAGQFALYLGTENSEGPWDVRHGGEIIQDEFEILIRGTIAERETTEFFEGTLQGTLGDRLFIAVPEQTGVDEALEKVFVLEDDLTLRVIVSNRGLLGRKRGVRIKSSPTRRLPRTGTE